MVAKDSPDPLLRLEEAAERIARRAEWEKSNRVSLLWVHALVGITAGAQMLLFGTASNIEQLVGVGARTALGSLGLTGGLILTYGIRRQPRAIVAEAIGLALIAVWDLLMTAGLFIARIQAGDFHMRGLTEPLPAPGTYVLPYPISVYAGLFGLICVHLWTIRRLGRDH